eukprot:EG_transcript_3053
MADASVLGPAGPGKGKGKGGAGRGRGGREPNEQYSRRLTRILRHSAKEDGIPIDDAGWVEVDVLLARQEFRGLQLPDVQRIVADCRKQRFCLKEEAGRHFIRANQGHSMEVPDLDLQPVTAAAEAPTVVHGTYHACWPTIQREGLCRMARQHIHFAVGRPGAGAVISGMRSNAQVLIFLDVEKCLQDGVLLLRSANNVILCPGVGDTGGLPPAYFKRVEDSATGRILLGAENSDAPSPGQLPQPRPVMTTPNTANTAPSMEKAGSGAGAVGQAEREESRLDQERAALETELKAAAAEEARQLEVMAGKRTYTEAFDEERVPETGGSGDPPSEDSDSDDEPAAPQPGAESVEALLSLFDAAPAPTATDAAESSTRPNRTILSPEEKTELLLLVKHMANICDSDVSSREQRLQVTPLVSRLVDLVPATQAFFAGHGWRGLRFRRRRFDAARLKRELSPLKRLEDAVLNAQAKGAGPKVSYAEAADQAVLRRTLFVAGLPTDGGGAGVQALFAEHGPLAQPVVLGAALDARLAGTALVQYAVPSAAAKARSLHGMLFQGQPLAVSVATALQATAFGVLLPSAKAKGEGGSSAPAPSTAAPAPAEARTALLVKGLPASQPAPLLEHSLQQLFRPYGPCTFALSPASGGPSGPTAIVQYQSEPSAVSAVQRVNGVAYQGNRIVVHFATADEVAEHGQLHPYQPAMPGLGVPATPFGTPAAGGARPGGGTRPSPASPSPATPLYRRNPFGSGPRPGPGVAVAASPGPPMTRSPTPAAVPPPERKKQVQSKKAMDTYLSEYEKFYLEQMDRDVSEYAATLSGAASPGQGT